MLPATQPSFDEDGVTMAVAAGGVDCVSDIARDTMAGVLVSTSLTHP